MNWFLFDVSAVAVYGKGLVLCIRDSHGGKVSTYANLALSMPDLAIIVNDLETAYDHLGLIRCTDQGIGTIAVRLST